MSGDVMNIFGKSYYYAPGASFTNSNSTSLIVSDIFNALLGSSGNPAQVKGITEPNLETLNSNLPTNLIRGGDGTTSSSPKAYINYIIFDDNLKYVSSGFPRVGSSGTVKNHWNDASMENIAVPKNAYLYVYVSNESNQDVFFDNLQVVHARGPLLEETHYYPFGLAMATISSSAVAFGQPENKFKLTSKELQSGEFNNGFGLELYDFGARFQDPQIGRWQQIDPLADLFSGINPYNDRENNPTNKYDPDGLSADENGPKNITDWVHLPKGNVIFDPNVHNDEDAAKLHGKDATDLGKEVDLFDLTTGSQVHGNADGTISPIEMAEFVVTAKRKQSNDNEIWSRNNFYFGTTATILEKSFGITRIGTNFSIYRATEFGRVFTGNQYVETFNMQKGRDYLEKCLFLPE